MYKAVQRQLIIWTSVLVVALGIVIIMTSLEPPTSQDSLFVSRAYARKHPRTRKTASVQAPQAKSQVAAIDLAISNGAKVLAVEVTLDCSGTDRSQFEPAVNQVRLSGKACVAGQEISSSEIRNEANGASATVFLPTPSSFTTDYLSLTPGENRIRILHYLKNGGREEREFVIERTPASQNQKM